MDELSASASSNRVSAPLEEALSAYVDACRANGDSPERVLLAVKAVIAQVRAGHPARRRGLADGDAERAFAERIVTLCIDCYFRDGGGA